MNSKNQCNNLVAPELNGATSDIPSRLPYYTVAQFSERNPVFSEAATRNLVFKAESRESSLGTIPGNGLIEAGAVIRIGRKVLINEAKFFAWAEAQQTRGSI